MSADGVMKRLMLCSCNIVIITRARVCPHRRKAVQQLLRLLKAAAAVGQGPQCVSTGGRSVEGLEAAGDTARRCLKVPTAHRSEELQQVTRQPSLPPCALPAPI